MGKYRWMVGLMVAVFSAAVAGAETAPPPEGGTLPEIVLPAPDNTEHRLYLGIRNGDGVFRIPDIDADVVIIEIFSMY
jgi:hypothetical protein